MIAPRWPLLLVAALACVLARRRPAVRPVAAALSLLAAIDFARLYTFAHFYEWRWGRVHTALAIAWPGVQAAFAWRAWVWRGWPVVALAFAAYACFIALAPWSWAAHPEAYELALRLPYWAGVAVGVVAWALKVKRPVASRALVGGGRLPAAFAAARMTARGEICGRVRDEHHRDSDDSAQASRAIAYVLTISAALDVTIGALAPFAEWTRAAPLAWATWGACAVVLGWKWLRTRPIRGRR